MKMLRILALSLAVCTACVSSAFAADVSYASALGGRIVSVLPVGTAVKQGDTLATVDSLVGPVPAARTSSDGVVKEALVTPGMQVKRGAALVVVEEK